MNSSGTRSAVIAVLAMVALSLAGCVVCGEHYELVDLRTETHTVDLQGAEKVVVTLDMGIGELKVGSGAESLAKAEFSYNVMEWEPEISYEVVDGTGLLHIVQHGEDGKSAPNKAKNSWLIALSDSVPIELVVDTGVGEVMLDLGDLMLTDLDVDHGVGELTIDLAGAGVRSLRANIDGGIGQVNVIVPSTVGVQLDGDTGIGAFKAAGFEKRGGSYVNGAYEPGAESIKLSIDAGIGEIRVMTNEA